MSDAPGNDVQEGLQVDSRESIGEQLRVAREKHNLGLDDVAKELHLDIDVIRALENDDREMLPAPIFVQGYLKSYARLVGLPIDGLIRGYSEQAGGPPPLSVIRTNTRLPGVRLQSIRLIRNIIILLMAAIFIWLAWPVLERYIDSQRESAGEDMPGRLQLPPAIERGGNNN